MFEDADSRRRTRFIEQVVDTLQEAENGHQAYLEILRLAQEYLRATEGVTVTLRWYENDRFRCVAFVFGPGWTNPDQIPAPRNDEDDSLPASAP